MPNQTASRRELPAGLLSRFFASLAMVFDSGLLLDEGLGILVEAAASPSEQALLRSLRDNLAEDRRLTGAMEQTGGFPGYAQAMLAMAEETGTMSDTCRALAVYYDKRDRLAGAVRSSLVYPLAMTAMIFIVVVMLLTQAMPVFDQVFRQLGYELSGLALAFLTAGSWLRGVAFGLTLALMLATAVCYIVYRLPVGRQVYDWVFEHNPVTGSLSFRLSLQRLMLGLAAMLRSGMAPQAATELAFGLVEDSRVRAGVQKMGQYLDAGDGFQQAMEKSGLLPQESRLLVAIGFSTGSNPEAFERIGENISASTERQMASLVAAIEPMLVAVMTVVVGVILLSVMLPLLGVLASI